MKQQELVHLHALLFEVREYLMREGTASADPLDRYEAQPTRPYHVHQGKDAHRTAVTRLLRGCIRLVRILHQQKEPASIETTPS